MDTPAEDTLPRPGGMRAHYARVVWHTIGLVVAGLVAYALWRGYQNPDLLLELSALRLC